MSSAAPGSNGFQPRSDPVRRLMYLFKYFMPIRGFQPLSISMSNKRRGPGR